MLKTKLDRHRFTLPDKDITLIVRYPSLRDHRAIVGMFVEAIKHEDENKSFDLICKGIDTILTGWEGADLPMYTGQCADILSLHDLLYVQHNLLNALVEAESESKKKIALSRLESKQAPSVTPAIPSPAQPTP
jgi:hypothetical protein